MVLKSLLGLNAVLATKLNGQQLFDEGSALRDAGKLAEGYSLILQSAEHGNENAMAVLGSIYLLGEGKEEWPEAVRWL